MSASSVSAVLRRGGILPTPRTREGVHVTGRDPVRVAVDIDSPRQRREVTEAAVAILAAAGYTITGRGDDDGVAAFYVQRS